MHDPQKIEEAVLALLGAFEFENGRIWKRFDFGVMESLAAQGLISDPRGRAESVYLTPEGLARLTDASRSIAMRTNGYRASNLSIKRQARLTRSDRKQL